jgi:hypothetical protein
LDGWKLLGGEVRYWMKMLENRRSVTPVYLGALLPRR